MNLNFWRRSETYHRSINYSWERRSTFFIRDRDNKASIFSPDDYLAETLEYDSLNLPKPSEKIGAFGAFIYNLESFFIKLPKNPAMRHDPSN